jgi:hypothetical protein
MVWVTGGRVARQGVEWARQITTAMTAPATGPR